MNEKEFEDIFESISSPCSGSFRIVNEGLEKVVKSNIEWGEDSEIDTDGVMDG